MSGIEDEKQALADAFNREIDPLEKHGPKFDEAGIDPFTLFIQDVLNPTDPEDPKPRTVQSYRNAIGDWCDYMDQKGRHPACPHEDHVKGFVQWLIDTKGNSRRTANFKLSKLNRVYQYWQSEAAFPHPVDYDPFQIARQKISLSAERVKDPPRIPIDDLRSILSEVRHLRDRAFIATQLKLGLRASEMANIKISEISLSNREVRDYYDDMGTSSHIDRYENAVYIPHDRDGNKSKRPRVLPIDDELRRVWVNYLLIRPDADQPWLFLSRSNHAQVTDEVINGAWKDAFRPEYDDTAQHRGVTSHYGRHRFTTYWRIEEDVNRELIKYMRGDVSDGGGHGPEGGIDHYIHSYYEDIEALYREQIYKLEI